MRLIEDMNICMVILLKRYEKNDHCISHIVIILLLNVLKGPLAYQIKTTTSTTTIYINWLHYVLNLAILQINKN